MKGALANVFWQLKYSFYIIIMDIIDFENENDYASQAGSGALLNPRVDSTFKALFTQPTEESRAALKSFLEAATEKPIKSVSLTSNDAVVEFSGQRNVSYDVACIFNDGLSAEIEMQAFNQKYDYGKRAEYQVARLETTYLRKGESWLKAPTVYQISVLNFGYKPWQRKNDENYKATTVSRYAMRTKDGRELSNSLNIVFVELPNAAALEKSLESNTLLENWAVFLRDADNPKKVDIIKKLTMKEEGIMQAQKSLSSISSSRELWLAQYRQEIFERDRISSMEAAQKEGLEMGYEKGMEKGIEKNKIETALSALKLGLSIEQISKITGLPRSEIEKL